MKAAQGGAWYYCTACLKAAHAADVLKTGFCRDTFPHAADCAWAQADPKRRQLSALLHSTAPTARVWVEDRWCFVSRPRT